jgi:hypothetical protein
MSMDETKREWPKPREAAARAIAAAYGDGSWDADTEWQAFLPEADAAIQTFREWALPTFFDALRAEAGEKK